MRHNQGIWNAIRSDMFIESTFVRYGHQAGWLTGLTLKPSAVTIWALSLRTCSQPRGDLLAMKDKQNNKTTITHKEAGPQIGLQVTHPIVWRLKKLFKIATDTHPPGLLNVVTGLHATDKVNAGESIKIEREHYGRIWICMANKLQQDTEQECDIDDFNQEKHQAGRKASIWYRVDLHTTHVYPTV